MFAEIQQAIVSHLEAARSGSAAASGRLKPESVRPYGGELAEPERLDRLAPIVLVEWQPSSLEAADLAATRWTGGLAYDVLCIASNRASGEAQYSDAVALAAWALESLGEMDLAAYSGRIARTSTRIVLRTKTLTGFALRLDIDGSA